MSESGADAPEQVVKFEPKRQPRSYDAPVEEAGQAIVAKIRRASELANETCDRAMKLAHKLSLELRAAEDRIKKAHRSEISLWRRTKVAPLGQVRSNHTSGRSSAAGENTAGNWAPCIDPSRPCALALCRRPIHALPECQRGDKAQLADRVGQVVRRDLRRDGPRCDRGRGGAAIMCSCCKSLGYCSYLVGSRDIKSVAGERRRS